MDPCTPPIRPTPAERCCTTSVRCSGRASCATCSACRSAALAFGAAVERPLRRDGRGVRLPRRHPDIGRRRRPAGGAHRPGLFHTWHGQEHLRHRKLRVVERRPDVPAANGRNVDNCCLAARRRHGRLCAGGRDLRDRRGDPVAARRIGIDRICRRDRSTGHQCRRQRRCVCRAGVHRPRESVVGPVRTRNHCRDHPRHVERSSGSGGRRGDGLPNPRCRRCDDQGQRHTPRRVASTAARR